MYLIVFFLDNRLLNRLIPGAASAAIALMEEELTVAQQDNVAVARGNPKALKQLFDR